MKIFIFNLIQKITFSKVFWKRKKNLYLSFDDGPDFKNTPLILDILSKHNAKATFFVIGEKAEKNLSILRRIADAGHTIANHSYSHLRYNNNIMQFLDDIEHCESVLKNANISSKKYVRIPYGTVSLILFSRLLSRGYQIAFWNKDTKDYKLKEFADLSLHMDIYNLESGDVILLHDFPELTPHIIENILSIHSDKKFVQM